MKDIQLQPGELALTRHAMRVGTILGSCVSFTMHHPASGLAAMSHCLLATRPSQKRPGEESHRHAYVDGTFEEMLAFFRQEGIAPSALEVKLFGGADVIQVLSGPKSVGRENINAAHRIMAHHGLRLAASDTGGKVGRKIQFATHTGSVHVHKMRSADDQQSATWLSASSLARQSG